MANLRGKGPSPKKVAGPTDYDKYLIEQERLRLVAEIEATEYQTIKNAIMKLSWEETENFVAGLLKAFDFIVWLTPKGGDLGSDIIASKDEFRMVGKVKVEVKKQKAKIGSPQLRNFIGGLRHYNNSYFVSISGFTKEAGYEAERSEYSVTLITLEDLIKFTKSKFHKLDRPTKALLGLKSSILSLDAQNKIINPDRPDSA